MFKKWLEIFKKDTLMDRAYQRSFMMLDLTREMFLKAKESLRFREDKDVDLNIRDQDLEINKYEREVRRNVFNHLVVGGKADLPSALVLVSIIVDIERIGDYTKNIVELAIDHPGKLKGGRFEKNLQRVEAAVEDNLIKTRACFETGDKKSALKLLKEYKWVNDVCDDSLIALIKEDDKDIRSGDSVALGIYFRWLKRINSHLRNITTSVVNPFDRIGYEPEEK
ncbi:MAG: PhoU domain-containing protein [Candidatus Aminicenantes bacterium]|nr:PhoU domain-containing protein [Candidatus Aminicenantes bacterium]